MCTAPGHRISKIAEGKRPSNSLGRACTLAALGRPAIEAGRDFRGIRRPLVNDGIPPSCAGANRPGASLSFPEPHLPHRGNAAAAL
jgi:hypothetical protein